MIIVVGSRNLKSQASWSELNQLQLEMTYVLLNVRLDVALAPIEKFKLTLKHQVRGWLAERVKFVVTPLFGIKDDLVVVAARNG